MTGALARPQNSEQLLCQMQVFFWGGLWFMVTKSQ